LHPCGSSPFHSCFILRLVLFRCSEEALTFRPDDHFTIVALFQRESGLWAFTIQTEDGTIHAVDAGHSRLGECLEELRAFKLKFLSPEQLTVVTSLIDHHEPQRAHGTRFNSRVLLTLRRSRTNVMIGVWQGPTSRRQLRSRLRPHGRWRPMWRLCLRTAEVHPLPLAPSVCWECARGGPPGGCRLQAAMAASCIRL
jgi:hypothetical protein